MRRRKAQGEFDAGQFRLRSRLVVAGLTLLATALGVRAVQLQVLDREFLAQEGDKRYLRMMNVLKEDWETPPAGDYFRQGLAGVPYYKTPKPRWESLHSIQGLVELYRITGDPEYKSTTRDVKKLLTELQKEKVDGVVIDLRNNGGGSLQEATELTSLFIEKGPTVLVRNSDGRVDVLEDENPGAFYKGPLALLVNRLSASASEIFAGAMQDYHRALIIGGQTFGKGTVQTIQPLNHGELKLTLAKFYRVSGQSTQHQGVLPDIDYPSIIDTKEIGESALPEAMPWDTIRPVVKPVADPFRPFLAQLKAQHEARSDKDAEFTYIRDRLALTQKLMNEKTVSLNEQERRARHDSIETKQLALENIRRKAKGEEPLKELKKEDEDALPVEDENTKPEDDAYLAETGRILIDYLSASTKVAKK